MRLLLISLLFEIASTFGIREIARNNRPSLSSFTPRKYMIDIDGTICTTQKSDYINSVPIVKNIRMFNELYMEGHEIHYWTARGAISMKDWDDFTIQQLKDWNVLYTTLNMDKPHYDVWLDDKSVTPNQLEKEKRGGGEECFSHANDGCEALFYDL